MFNLSRALKFLGRLTGFLSFISLLILLLAFIPEALTQQPERWTTVGFWLQVILNIFPFVVVVVAIYWLGGRFVRDVYHLKNIRQGLGFLICRQFGQLSFGPWLILSQGKIDLDPDGLVVKMGGPGGLIIHNDTAIVLEQRGQLTRVEGPGFPTLKPFEMIYDIIDLRPKRRVYQVNGMTKEGISVSWTVEVQYKIADDNQVPTDKVPYPFTREAVFRAATGKWRRESGQLQDMDWEGWLIISQTEAMLRSILARHHLDDLIDLAEADHPTAHESIQIELKQELGHVASEMGARIIEVKLGTFEVDDDVTQQWIEEWQDRWQQLSADQLAREKANDIKSYGPIKTRAELLPTTTLSQALEKLDTDQARLVVLMRLFDTLSQLRQERDTHFFLPAEALALLEKLPQATRGISDITYRDHNDIVIEVDKSQSETITPPKIIKTPKPLVIPIKGQIAAGQEYLPLDEQITGYFERINDSEFINKKSKDEILKAKAFKEDVLRFLEDYQYFALEVVGESMNRVGISSGDYVILEKPKFTPVHPISGDIVAAVFHHQGHKTTLKRICFNPKVNSVILQPDSLDPTYEPHNLAKNDFAGENPGVEIIAIAVAVLKQKQSCRKPLQKI